jgi:hypothetical protein
MIEAASRAGARLAFGIARSPHGGRAARANRAGALRPGVGVNRTTTAVHTPRADRGVNYFSTNSRITS